MKKIIWLFLFATIGTIAMAQNGANRGETISFMNEIGCEIHYDIVELADIISSSDTLLDCKEASEILAEYTKTFPSDMYGNEPAILLLVPDDNYFNVICIQEDVDDEIISIRILTISGWIEMTSDPRSDEVLDLQGMICFLQDIIDVLGE